ncbi:MAG TPA: hypothetical protein VKW06_10865 [Candidatus Angelobacter sp.]|nr:hypothetical protein [Candidatus Angelobacter sp.]
MPRTFFVLVVAVAILLSGAHICAAAQDDANNANGSRAKGPTTLVFSVVHVHFGNNCAGRLYVNREKVRYEVLAPENFKSHSFEIERSSITAVQPWVLMGQPQNIVEMKTAKTTYHFWVLRKGADPVAARSGNLKEIADPAEKLISGLQDPDAMLAKLSAAKAHEHEGDAGAPGADVGGANPARDRQSARRDQPPAGGDSSSDSAPGAQPEPQSPAGALEGIYVGFGLDHSHQGHRMYYFSPDGWVINNIPWVNMDNFNMTAYRNDPNNKLFVGRYRVDGNQIHIVWANNADSRTVIKFNNAAAEPGIDMYIPTCRCTGKRFSGRYHWASPTDQRYVQFFPDGRFLDHGLIDQVVSPNPHGYAGITDPPRNFRGTYSILNQRLTFNFSDGKQATVAFIAPKALANAPSFGWFGLGHDSGVRGADTVIVLMMYSEDYQVQP